jgi:hypothetical protein
MPKKKATKPPTPKLSYEMTATENWAWVQADVKRQLAPTKPLLKEEVPPKVV